MHKQSYSFVEKVPQVIFMLPDCIQSTCLFRLLEFFALKWINLNSYLRNCFSFGLECGNPNAVIIIIYNFPKPVIYGTAYNF
jgi:hypothetical protein